MPLKTAFWRRARFDAGSGRCQTPRQRTGRKTEILHRVRTACDPIKQQS